MTATRKLPVRINEKKRTTHRSEYLVPRLSDVAPEDGFISIKTGRVIERGSVVYLGRDVTPEMMLERFCEQQPPPADRVEALRRLSAYIEALQQFRIGNVLTVSYSPDGLPILHVVEEYFLSETHSKLP
jgi:hypothetical protein